MYITSGRLKGQKIETPRGGRTRPTSGRLRQAFFNIVAPYIEGANFLDLCAGSGAMGLEARSAHARAVTFVDSSREACRAIRANIKRMNLEHGARVLESSLPRALEQLLEEGSVFDIIYFDPPYESVGLIEEVLSFMDQHPALLGKEGRLFLEVSRRVSIEKFPVHQLTLESKRQSGDSMLIMYKNVN
jgi:16S rRNA (guanine(966)-N(2))-methyltransferase RsmD